MSPIDLQSIAERVRSEFNEMPGLRLTTLQAARMWGLDGPSCGAVIDLLIRWPGSSHNAVPTSRCVSTSQDVSADRSRRTL